MKYSSIVLSTFLLINTAYASDNWIDSNKVPVRDASGNCIRNGVWTPATAHPQCVPDLKPVSKPVAGPAPQVVQAPPTPAPRPPAPAPVPVVTKVTIQSDVLFDFDKSVIKPEGRVRLNDFVAKTKAVSYDVVIVVGHTDSIGTDAYNMKLGLRRAESVKAYLVSSGFNANSIKTSSKGESEPVADNKTSQGRALNRRVVIEVIGNKK